jgi:hypothetical protein
MYKVCRVETRKRIIRFGNVSWPRKRHKYLKSWREIGKMQIIKASEGIKLMESVLKEKKMY